MLKVDRKTGEPLKVEYTVTITDEPFDVEEGLEELFGEQETIYLEE